MNEWRTRVPIPTGRAVVVAATLAIVVLALPIPPVPGLIAANGALLLAVIVDALLAPSPAAVDVERDAPPIVALRSSADVAWTFRLRQPRSAHLEFADVLPPALGAETRRGAVSLPARGRRTITAELQPTRRGRYELGPITLRVRGPGGLASRQGVLPLAGTVRVYPSFRSRAEAELRLERARLLEVGLRSARGHGGGTEFDSLREYVEDDEYRRIDWAATARATKPIVRDYRSERNQHVLILLDLGRTMAARIAEGRSDASGDELPRLDHGMDAAMALTTVATRLGDRVGLIAFGADIRAVVPPSHTAGQTARVTAALYRLEPELAESDYRGAFVTALTRFRRRALLVVITELAEEALEDTLLPALPLVLRDHVVIVAGLRDAAMVEWALSSPPDAAAAYRKAAAVERLAARRRLEAHLVGRGARVVDEVPAVMPAELADAYLEIKARGRL